MVDRPHIQAVEGNQKLEMISSINQEKSFVVFFFTFIAVWNKLNEAVWLCAAPFRPLWRSTRWSTRAKGRVWRSARPSWRSCAGRARAANTRPSTETRRCRSVCELKVCVEVFSAFHLILTGREEPVSWSVEEPFTTSHNWLHLYSNKGTRAASGWTHASSSACGAEMALWCFSLLLMGFMLRRAR